MMHRVPFVFLRTPLEERKICDPEKIPVRAGLLRAGVAVCGPDQILDLGHPQSNSAENFASDFPFVRAEKEAVAFFDLEFRTQRGLLSAREKFHDGRFPFAVLDLDEGETLGAVELRNFS